MGPWGPWSCNTDEKWGSTLLHAQQGELLRGCGPVALWWSVGLGGHRGGNRHYCPWWKGKGKES
jgi:hypothetical protein